MVLTDAATRAESRSTAFPSHLASHRLSAHVGAQAIVAAFTANDLKENL